MPVFVVSKELFEMKTKQIRRYALRQPSVIPALTGKETREKLFCNGK